MNDQQSTLLPLETSQYYFQDCFSGNEWPAVNITTPWNLTILLSRLLLWKWMTSSQHYYPLKPHNITFKIASLEMNDQQSTLLPLETSGQFRYTIWHFETKSSSFNGIMTFCCIQTSHTFIIQEIKGFPELFLCFPYVFQGYLKYTKQFPWDVDRFLSVQYRN